MRDDHAVLPSVICVRPMPRRCQKTARVPSRVPHPISSAWSASEVNSSSLSAVGAARLDAGEKVHHIRRSRLPDVLVPLAFMLSYDVPLLTSDVVRLLPREQAMRRAC